MSKLRSLVKGRGRSRRLTSGPFPWPSIVMTKAPLRGLTALMVTVNPASLQACSIIPAFLRNTDLHWTNTYSMPWQYYVTNIWWKSTCMQRRNLPGFAMFNNNVLRTVRACFHSFRTSFFFAHFRRHVGYFLDHRRSRSLLHGHSNCFWYSWNLCQESFRYRQKISIYRYRYILTKKMLVRKNGMKYLWRVCKRIKKSYYYYCYKVRSKKMDRYRGSDRYRYRGRIVVIPIAIVVDDRRYKIDSFFARCLDGTVW